MELAAAITVLAFPISLGGLIRLKLCQFLLHAPLHLLAFVQGETEISETSPVNRPFDIGNFTTPRNAVHPNKLDGNDHLQLRCQRVPFPKKHSTTRRFLPPRFPVPSLSSHLRTLLISTQN